MTTNSNFRQGSVRTIALCFIVALLEGLDLQVTGLAASGIGAEFKLSPAQMGWMFSAGLLGLLPGGFVGGRLADKIGRKMILVISVILFGVFSLASVYAWDYSSFLAARLMTGLGLGAALPVLILLSSEAFEEKYRSTAVSMTYCGVPLGGALASLFGMLNLGYGWRSLFYIGGLLPIIVAIALLIWLPESRAFQKENLSRGQRQATTQTAFSDLFRHKMWHSTTLLWLGFFFTITTLYLLLNWLPSLLMRQGIDRSHASIVQIFFNLGGAAGALLTGRLLDRTRPAMVVVLTYTGMLLSLAALGLSDSFAVMVLAGGLAGYCALGAQLVQYSLAPKLYSTYIRATGVGTALTIGRMGAVGGPLIAGAILATGAGVGGVMLAASPGLVIAAACALVLFEKRAIRS
ncbi:AAHS family 3-hydroxyphenylpropionic acid transporter [Undibacterium sp. GrIS 1.8]|uniref:3-(3-hydroxy-phenyl)propionate transporter MhpT n=1 Tax=unclassified Undibacterium TaxID=2630295 RepID=UPI003399503F